MIKPFDKLTDKQREQLLRLSENQKFEILKAMSIPTDDLLGWMISSHEQAIERNKGLEINFDWGPRVIKGWRKLVEDLRIARENFQKK